MCSGYSRHQVINMEEFAPREVQAVQDYLRIKIDVAKADGPVWNNFKSPQESFSIRMH